MILASNAAKSAAASRNEHDCAVHPGPEALLKYSTTLCPSRADRVTAAPSVAARVKSGALLPSASIVNGRREQTAVVWAGRNSRDGVETKVRDIFADVAPLLLFSFRRLEVWRDIDLGVEVYVTVNGHTYS